jgi:aspartyl-tRNA(Asn)/glutamyl-tRNA(Gln) amidotransferase subunit B
LLARNCGLRRVRFEMPLQRVCWSSSTGGTAVVGESRKDRRRREAAEALKAQTVFERNTTNNTVKGATGDWEVIVGIELHAQINESRKLFSNAPTSFGLEPNRFVAPLDAALPGTLPVLNVACVRRAVHTALALNAQINPVSYFDRKHYFYADMPAGFQITQYRKPIASGGHVDVVLDSGVAKRVSLAHIQLEQDSGKTVLGSGALERLVDLNRAGSALMEIVSNADMRSAAEAGAYVRHMQRLLRAVDSCAANMDQGDLRCDVNVSVRRAGVAQFGERVEIKNVNSVRFLVSAIDYEVDRQIALLEAGEQVEQETRAFDSRSSQTVRLRTKEQAVDYRFMPEPDLPPLHVSTESLAAWSRELPPLPAQLQAQLENECAMSARDALAVIDEPGALVYLKRLIDCGVEPAIAAKWLLNDVIAHAHAQNIDIARFAISADRLAELINSIVSGALTGAVARRVVWPRLLAGDTRDSATIASEHGVAPIDDAELERACADAVALIASDADAAKAAKRVVEGDEKWMRFFVGKVMRATGGRANAEQAHRRLHELILKR